MRWDWFADLGAEIAFQRGQQKTTMCHEIEVSGNLAMERGIPVTWLMRSLVSFPRRGSFPESASDAWTRMVRG